MIDNENLPLTAIPRSLSAQPVLDDRAQHPNHYRKAKIDYVVDGDSVYLYIDLDFDGLYARRNCRMIGIDAPDKNPERTASKEWLMKRLFPGLSVLVYLPDTDKYGRPLVAIYLDETSPSLNDLSLNAGMSVPYYGGTR